MPIAHGARLEQKQEPGTQSKPSMWITETQLLAHPFDLSGCAFAQSWNQEPGIKPKQKLGLGSQAFQLVF